MLDKKTVIALGYFDSVHNGHRKVLEQAKRIANESNAQFVVFTFEKNVKAFFTEQEDKSVYTAEERQQILKELGADEIFFAPVTKEFLGMKKEEFLNFLNEKYKISCYVSGSDYTFGRKGSGNIEYLKKYAENNNQTYVMVDTVSFAERKISTTRIKELLKAGNVKSANYMLGRKYSVCGKVFSDRGMGRELGFPTLNIKLQSDKFRLIDGVYKGHIFIDGKFYNTIINYGARPTFGLNEKIVEAHVIDFEGDLYGQVVTVFFDAFIRNIMKFDSLTNLKKQLQFDMSAVRNGEYD